MLTSMASPYAAQPVQGQLCPLDPNCSQLGSSPSDINHKETFRHTCKYGSSCTSSDSTHERRFIHPAGGLGPVSHQPGSYHPHPHPQPHPHQPPHQLQPQVHYAPQLTQPGFQSPSQRQQPYIPGVTTAPLAASSSAPGFNPQFLQQQQPMQMAPTAYHPAMQQPPLQMQQQQQQPVRAQCSTLNCTQYDVAHLSAFWHTCPHGMHCTEVKNPLHTGYFQHGVPATPATNPATNPALPPGMQVCVYGNGCRMQHRGDQDHISRFWHPPTPVPGNSIVAAAAQPPPGMTACQYGDQCRKLARGEQPHCQYFWHPPSPSAAAHPGGPSSTECRHGVMCHLYRRFTKANSSKGSGNGNSKGLGPATPKDTAHCGLFTHLSLGTLAITFPSDWPWDLSNIHSVQKYELFKLNSGSKEYKHFEKLFLSTLPKATVKTIERIHHLTLWKNYFSVRDQIESDNNGDAVEKFLFHGTDMNILDTVISEGFDSRLAAQSSAFGVGSYFARDAQYSDSYVKNPKTTKKMFIARVALGDYIAGASGMKRPPKKPNTTDEYFNSVSGYNDSIWCVFDRYQAYPQYIIEYS